MDFRTRAEQGVLLFDGAMGTMIHAANPADADFQGHTGCPEILNVSRPDLIEAIHCAYLEVGSDVVGTNSFGANRIVLGDYGIEDRAFELARSAARIARKAADRYSTPGKPRFVAGSMGPGTRLVSLGQTDWDTMYRSYTDQAAGLLEGGVDLFLVETCQDLLQIKCALTAIADVLAAAGRDTSAGNETPGTERLSAVDPLSTFPVIVTVTVETTGTLLVGSELAAVIAALEPFPIFALGLNCATGPDDMLPFITELSETWPRRILIQPNAGLPRNVDGNTVYDLPVAEYVRAMSSFITRYGIDAAGGCCGTTPEYIAALAAVLPSLAQAERKPVETPSVASLFSAQALMQEPAPFYIGERTNTNGSKLFREALLRDDWDALVEIARNQAASGVHGLDVCVAYTGRDEVRDMSETLRRFVTRINLPLVIDSTEYAVLEAALKLYGGRAIINSVNLEDGEERAHRICALAKRYGAALIALTIDESGMARTVEGKLAVARRLHDIAVNGHGMRSEDLIFDVLTFTLGSGDETLRTSALDTIEGIRTVKAALPGVKTVLGLSNVSFGLSVHSRKVLNSVFLSDCVEAGLDMAIVNLAHILPVSALEGDDLEAARKLIANDHGSGDPLHGFIRHFESKDPASFSASQGIGQEDGLTTAEKLSRRIVSGSRAGLEDLLAEERAIRSPLSIINDTLIPAMKIVGELFGSGKMQLPFVLQSAEVMKAAVSLLEPFMEKAEGESQTSIVLATVRGDVHDIGKNLVEIILSNNGYKVYNLGIKVEIGEIIRKLEETNADAVGMSGLLVKSTVVMKENIQELAARGLAVPVLLGGAALTPSYVNGVCADAHIGPVMYCQDAFEGLRAMNLIKEGKLEEYLAAERARLAALDASRKASRVEAVADDAPLVLADITPPVAPFLGIRELSGVSLDTVYGFLTEEVLFRGRWGFRRGSLSREEYETLIEKEVKPLFVALKEKSRVEGLIVPRVSYGYFECNAEGDSVVLYDPAFPAERRPLATLGFPRQAAGSRLCIADFFKPAESGKVDLIALQLCTVGSRAQEECAALYAADRYREYLLFHGLAVECAEALAEYTHLHIRRELDITGEDGQGISDFVEQKYRGSRYSFGYPACPDLANNAVLCDLLDGPSIGVTMTDGYQMVPEQTTSAFVVHHPQAKYFSV